MTSTSDCADNKDILHPAMKKLRTPGISKETILKEYEDWANTYDSVTLSRGYKAPDLAVHYLSDSFPKDIRSEKKIIDVGAGTGLAARRLQAEGFRHIDALDASEAMMNVAMENNLYEKYFCEFIGATPLPIETGTYDGLTAVACISSTHIKPDAFAELVRIVKPGGIVVFVARSGAIHSSQTFTDWFYSSIDKLEKEGKWKKLVETTGISQAQYFAARRGDAQLQFVCQPCLLRIPLRDSEAVEVADEGTEALFGEIADAEESVATSMNADFTLEAPSLSFFSDASSVIPDDTPVDVDMADNGSASLQLDDSSTLPTTTDMNL